MDESIVKVPPVNILIVDDEPRNLAVLETVLDDPGYKLVRATSGEEALLALMADEFAVLVLDVRMPGMSGFELAAMVKERRKTSRIPIIFLTAYYNEDQHILEGYGTGAVDYLHKPVNASVLKSKVAVFAELHRKGRMLEEANRMLLGEVAERRNAESRLSELAQTLEQRVRERTAELEASEERLLEANRRKDEFLATLAHELRNPLAPVRNAIEVLKLRPAEPASVQWATGVVDRQVLALGRLIDDLMDLSRVSQGRIELRRSLVPLNDVLTDAIETVRPLVESMRHELVVMLPDSAVAVDADPTRLSQAFVNLLNNAVKYTDPGGRIEVGVLVEKGDVVVTIRDNGIGIAAEHLEGVFEMFSQVESALSRSRGGLGIGLALTQRLVRMHGGSVKAYSDGPGRGSRFHVQLPLAAGLPASEPASPAAEPSRAAGGPKLRVVVADDNRDAAETLGALLRMLEHDVQVVHDGEAAVAACAAHDPDIVILDIGMPRMNGYDACRRIRTHPGGAGRTIIALTGWGQEKDLALSREAGFDRHFVKPVDVAQLIELIGTLQPRPAVPPLSNQGG